MTITSYLKTLPVVLLASLTACTAVIEDPVKVTNPGTSTQNNQSSSTASNTSTSSAAESSATASNSSAAANSSQTANQSSSAASHSNATANLVDATLTWDRPLTRENGQPLDNSEIDHYLVSYKTTAQSAWQEEKTTANENSIELSLVDNDSYQIRVITIDTNNQPSVTSDTLNFNVN